MNENDILAVKAIQSGIFNKVAIEGLGDVNITSVFEVLLKDSSYILDSYERLSKVINLKIPSRNTTKSESVMSWRKRTKAKLVEYKGGKCECCGYNNCIEALEFHHIDPS